MVTYTPAQIRSAKIQGMSVEKFVSGIKALQESVESNNQEPYDPTPPNECPNCGSKETKQTNIYMCDDANICEYTLKCKVCETVLGHWSYGHWQY